MHRWNLHITYSFMQIPFFLSSSYNVDNDHSHSILGECLEVSLQKNLRCLQLASISLLRPLHSLPQGSGFSAFLRRTNHHLQHLNSDLTGLSSGFSLSLCPSSSLTFFSEASTSWLHSKYCFDQQRDNPFIAKWNPNLESTGRYSLKIEVSFIYFMFNISLIFSVFCRELFTLWWCNVHSGSSVIFCDFENSSWYSLHAHLISNVNYKKGTRVCH